MPVAFKERLGGSIFGDRISMEQGDGVVHGDSFDKAYVRLDSGVVIPGKIDVKPIFWDQGRPGRCFVFIPQDSDQSFQFSDHPLITR